MGANNAVIRHNRLTFFAVGLALTSFCQTTSNTEQGAALSTLLPMGKRITPTAAPGAHFELQNPGLKDFPEFLAGQAISTAVSPDQKTLLILTSGFNQINGTDGNPIA